MMYYLKLSLRYMRHNLKRTIFSLVAISLSYILCFCVVDAFYSFWDYEYEQYVRMMPYELFYHMNGENEESDEDTISRIKALGRDAAVEKLRINLIGEGEQKLVLESQLKTGKRYSLQVKLADNKSLRASANALSEKYGFSFYISTGMEHYLRQDDSASTALTNFLIYLAATVLGFFGGAVIRNTMMMSVTERNRDYGLLRCVGMSGPQLLIVLLIESLLLGSIASLLGMNIGYEILLLIEPLLIRSLALWEFFHFGFYPVAAIYAYVLCIALTIFSLVEPFRLSSQVSPLEALHGKLAKELTVDEALKRIAKRFIKEKKRKKKSLWERLFGTPGFLAQRNRYRRRGGGGALFFSVFLSSMLLLSVLCATGSVRKTVRQQFDQIKLRYSEVLFVDLTALTPPTEDARYENIRTAVEGREDVNDAVIAMVQLSQYDKNRFSSAALEDEKAYLYELGFFKEDMEKEVPYLAEGEIDYERMLDERGVLIYDMSTDGSFASYKAGDRFEMISPEGSLEAYKVFCDALEKVEEESGIPAWGKYALVRDEGDSGRVSGMKEDVTPLINAMPSVIGWDRFGEIKAMMSNALKEMGYDCSAYEKDDSYSLQDYISWLRSLFYERGYRETYTIFGILNEEQYSTGRVLYTDRNVKNVLCVVYPMEILIDRYERILELRGGKYINDAKAEPRDVYARVALAERFYYEVGINRKGNLLDTSIQGYANQHGLTYIDPCSLAGIYSGYFSLLNYLNALSLISVIIGGFILLICLFNIMNTLLADMQIRKRELWLCRVVGMDDKQMLKMLFIEHGFSAVAALVLGALLSLVLSRLAFSVLFWDDSIKYSWPWGAALLLLLAMVGILYLICSREIKSEDVISGR